MAPALQADRPNIVLILADDLGYGDVGVFRGSAPWKNREPVPENVSPPGTPALDRLAREGMKLTSFYTNDSVCSPTRAALMTGRYNHRTGVVNVLGQLSSGMQKISSQDQETFSGLPLEEFTLPEFLKDQGYNTACFGKWHLGDFKKHHPMDKGFDHYVGCEDWAGDNFSLKDPSGNSYFYRDREIVEAPGYWYTDVLVDEAIRYMSQDHNRPFFTYLALTTPHLPLIGPDDKVIANKWNEEKDSRFGPRNDLHQAYKEVVEGMDAAIGRLLQHLKKSGLEENTLIIFTSDNGPVDYGSCAPFRGRKNWFWEGGIRVPTIVTWKGRVTPGSTSNTPAMTMDLLPTIASILKAPLPSDRIIDGADISGIFLENDLPAPRKFFWEKPVGVQMYKFHQRRWAVRDGPWKLVHDSPGKPLELFNLKSDPKEQHNLADQYPGIVNLLKDSFQRWKSTVYQDCPYDLDEVIQGLKAKGIIKVEDN